MAQKLCIRPHPKQPQRGVVANPLSFPQTAPHNMCHHKKNCWCDMLYKVPGHAMGSPVAHQHCSPHRRTLSTSLKNLQCRSLTTTRSQSGQQPCCTLALLTALSQGVHAAATRLLFANTFTKHFLMNHSQRWLANRHCRKLLTGPAPQSPAQGWG